MSDLDEQLVEQAKAGSYFAASELVGLYYERIYAYLRRLCNQHEDAADLTQKTFMRLWAALPTYAARSAFSTWLHGIAHHVYLDWRRQKRPSDLQSEEWWDACAAPGGNPFDHAAERDTAHQLYALVEELGEDTRQTVHLHYYQGLTLAETAEVLEVSASTVKNRLRDALGFLRARTADLPGHQNQTTNKTH